MHGTKGKVVLALPEARTSQASLNRSFVEGFMTLNTITFADMARREKDGVSWDVRRVSSP